MANAVIDMPNMSSARIVQISELNSLQPDDVHGNSIRVLGRVKSINAVTSRLTVEYHNAQLKISTELLDRLERFRPGALCQFIGELQKEGGEFLLRARLCRDMNGLDPNLYERCLRVRRNFEKQLLPSSEQGTPTE